MIYPLLLDQGLTDSSSAAPCQARGTSLFPHQMWDRKGAGSIGNPRRAVRLYFRPKPVSVKRRNRSERPERLLSERSEFQTRQRTKGTE